MHDLNIRKGKGWIKKKKMPNEDGSNASNKSLERGVVDDDDDEEGNSKVMLSQDDHSIGQMLRENYMPPNKKEQEALTKEERDKIEK